MAETNYAELYTKKYSDKMKSQILHHPPLIASSVGDTKTDIVGDSFQYAFIGRRTMSENTDPKGNTPDNGNTTSLRIMKPKNFHDGILHNRKFSLLSQWGDDIGSKTVDAMKQAANEKVDAVVVEALLGNALVGKSETITPLPATQKVAVNYVRSGTEANTGLTVVKLRKAKQMLSKAKVIINGKDQNGNVPIVLISSGMLNDLMDDPLLTDAQRTQVNLLLNGEPQNFLGFKFIQYEDLPIDSTSKVRKCVVYVSAAIARGIWKDVSVSFDKRPDKQNNTQTYCEFDCGATRTMEEGVIEISCKSADDA